MIDKELIKMCDIPEIQDRWDAYMGQHFVIKGWESYIFYSIEIDREAEDTLISNGQGITRWFHDVGDSVIYIPRLEDVLEWVVPKRFSSWSSAHSEVERMYYSYDMAIKGWLAMAMHLEHNKTWNGGEWK